MKPGEQDTYCFRTVIQPIDAAPPELAAVVDVEDRPHVGHSCAVTDGDLLVWRFKNERVFRNLARLWRDNPALLIRRFELALSLEDR